MVAQGGGLWHSVKLNGEPFLGVHNALQVRGLNVLHYLTLLCVVSIDPPTSEQTTHLHQSWNGTWNRVLRFYQIKRHS